MAIGSECDNIHRKGIVYKVFRGRAVKIQKEFFVAVMYIYRVLIFKEVH